MREAIQQGNGPFSFHRLPGVILAILWFAIGCVAVIIATSSVQDIPFLERLLAPFSGYIPSEKAMYSPLAYFCVLTLVALLEYRVPAQRQPIISPHLAHDMLWYVTTLFFRITFLGLYAGLLYSLYHAYLSFLDVDAAAKWHPAVRFLVAILVADFMRWLAHLITHKVPWFWEFHAVHHSQRHLNFFTDARVHPVDHMIAGTIKFIPLFMFDNALPYVIAWAIFETVYPKFYHANVRLDFGPLRYLLVTPQSHRVHHGIAPQYQDKNFGFTFSIWDRIFGTQCNDHTVYPETGIADSEFPHEHGVGPVMTLRYYLHQLIYPFTRLSQIRRGA